MIENRENLYVLSTVNTTYAFQVMESGQLEHLYYGRKIRLEAADFITEKYAFCPGNTIAYSEEHKNFSLEDCCLEMSSYGKGDIREPFIEVVHADGGSTSDFVFDCAVISKGKEAYRTLPGSYGTEEEVEHLTVILKDKQYYLTLELHYYVYEKEDVITRSSRLINESNEEIRLARLMSTQVDFDRAGYVFTTFNGAWAREMQRHDTVVNTGKTVNSSYTGSSSSRANPFVMVSRENTTEETGDCYGFNLIYSGNHYEAVEVSGFEKTRIVTGINPQSFSFLLTPGEDFEAPEAVMTYSHEGFSGASLHMQRFVREHIVRGEWKNKVRPVLLNSWEASYFDINERKLLNLAKAGKEVGIELFVMDDGWFGTRNDDTQSLGDWYVNEKKLPNGLTGLAEKINRLGLDFGIWVEPEMVSLNSECYRNHPEWVMEIPDKPHAEGRNQRILDLANPEVQDYIIEQMTKVFSSADISYVKWDMNRIFSDYYSQYLPKERQQETAHRYMLGFYRVMQALNERFPSILFEGCAAGGNRFDLGMLCYFPQIWASDNTDANCRVETQTGYSYGYPMSTVGAHVSACPNHQTLRITPLETRFHVASFGVLGYECNFCDMGKEELAEIAAQIELYKQWREVLQFGDFYRGRSGNIHEWTCVSADQTKAVGMLMQTLVTPNWRYETYTAKGLSAEKKYHFYSKIKKYNIKEFGDLINTVSPIHIKQNSIAQNVIAKFVKMDSEVEDTYVYGDALMYSGVKLKQAFAGTGYNREVRYFQDFASRLYFMEVGEHE
ncbi:alpha-galactosidase [Konateibacter massiliensis]|uniref:alpha-galactosidase n=1 Tax=Konateibacter massiliensis TaxID=2002841 RepID=UPI000C15D2C6|nr:alpha-galactosidase [Konateibacter massiliensis]